MPKLRSYAVPFSLLCKLCGAPEETVEELEQGSVVTPVVAQAEAEGAPTSSTDALAPSAPAELAYVELEAMSLDAVGATAAESSTDDSAAAALPCVGPPGLYREGSCDMLAEGVRPYAPRFQLWSDGEIKERFVYLPPGSVIDATNPDRWNYPVGTRLYKTFAQGSFRLETRVIEKVAPGRGPDAWSFRAYAWDDTQTQAKLVEVEGRADVLGTHHDIPSVAQCRSCHSAAGQDAVNGFSAIQLNHQSRQLSLSTLISQRTVRTPYRHQLVAAARLPGNELDQAALGILHVNCGHCHGGPRPRGRLSLWTTVGQPDLASSNVYRALVGAPLEVWLDHTNTEGAALALRVRPGAPLLSGVVARMSLRGSRDQMPPIGSEVVDTESVATLSKWIETLER